MKFLLTTKPSFLSDFLRLNRDLQHRFIEATQELEVSPDTPHGDTIKKLKYHEKLWRYRIADYRMVYAVYSDQKVVQLLGVAPRGEIYERMNYNPDEPDYQHFSEALEKALDPNQETPVEWMKYMAGRSEAPSESRSLPYHLTPTQLQKWNIPSQFHAAFQGCQTEDDLLERDVPEEVLLHLMNCLWPADVAQITQSPNLLVSQPADLLRFAQGDLITFLLALDEDQQRMVEFSLSGPTLVKGGPGSGKSTVALYRVGAIIRRAVAESKPVRILFTTYTNALITASQQLLTRILEKEHVSPNSDLVKLDVQTLDSIGMRMLTEGSNRPRMAQTGDLKYSLTHARTSFRPEGANPLENAMIQKAVDSLREEYLLEEFDWVIEGRGLSTVDEYLRTDRSGRGYSFDPRMRRAVWQLYQHSRNFIHNLGQITWGELRIKAIEKILNGGWKEKWDFVLVDEAQDLTPVALSLAIELCTSPKGIFLTADALQSLYNKGFAWKNVHEALQVTGRTRILRRNYRTTRQIAEAAATLLDKLNAVEDEEALDQFYVHAGPAPKIYAALNEDDLFMWLAHEIQAAARELHLPIGSAAILAPTNELAKMAANRLTQVGLPTDYMSGKELDLQSSNVKAITIHSAKGLEFPIIAIPYVEEGFLPRTLPDERADDLEKHLKQEVRVLFVGCTRSMRRLFIAYRMENVSRFIKEIDNRYWKISDFA